MVYLLGDGLRWLKQPVTFNEAEVMWVMSDTAGMKGTWAGKGFMPHHVQVERTVAGCEWNATVVS